MFRLIVNICEYGIALLSYIHTKNALDKVQKEYNDIQTLRQRNNIRLETIQQIHQFNPVDRRVDKVGIPLHDICISTRKIKN